MGKDLSEMTLEELWELFPIFLVAHDDRWKDSFNLWQQVNSNFADIADLGMKNADGSFVGFWGAMSDETMSFMPWTDDFSRGLYLAGVEVYEDTPVPEGWVKWVMPARKYLVTEVAPETYEETFRNQRLHHEIYLSDARKVAPEKLKTVIRHPIRKG